MTSGFLVAGTHSGVGKTTVALGLMAALSRRYRVQPFKVGPDFIDPSLHSRVCGRPSRNLDTYLMGRGGVRETFLRACQGADVAVVEGVMGLYDGLGSETKGSSAEVGRILGLPVVLVVDGRGISRSIAALALGYRDFERGLDFAGVIVNRVKSQRHRELLSQALGEVGIPLLGVLPPNMDVSIPSRHLGLEMEGDLDPERLADFMEEHLDLEVFTRLTPELVPGVPGSDNADRKEGGLVRIGVALDSAFCFYYQDVFDHLRRLGCEPVFFSPLAGEMPRVDGLYLGGGYPELFAARLEASNTRKHIKKAVEDGMPVYAECGGMLYLTDTLETRDGVHRMVGVLPAEARMTPKIQGLGYTLAETMRANTLTLPGTETRGHEFHYSTVECHRDARFAFRLLRGRGIDGRDGLMEYRVTASYMHTHPCSLSLERFVAVCNNYKKR